MIEFEGEIFEGKLSSKKNKPKLEDLFFSLESEFLREMHCHFDKYYKPDPLPVLIRRLPIIYSHEMIGKDNVLYLDEHTLYEDSLDCLKTLHFACMHGAGHHLHFSANYTLDKDRLKISHEKEGDEWVLAEIVAELSAVTFFGWTNRVVPDGIKNDSLQHPLMVAVQEFYRDNGLACSLRTLSRLTSLNFGKVNRDIYDIKKRANAIAER